MLTHLQLTSMVKISPKICFNFPRKVFIWGNFNRLNFPGNLLKFPQKYVLISPIKYLFEEIKTDIWGN